MQENFHAAPQCASWSVFMCVCRGVSAAVVNNQLHQRQAKSMSAAQEHQDPIDAGTTYIGSFKAVLQFQMKIIASLTSRMNTKSVSCLSLQVYGLLRQQR